MSLSSQYKAAFARATPEAVAAALLTALATYQSTRSVEATIWAFVVPLITVIAGRGYLEGRHDTRRAETGDVRTADVGAQPSVGGVIVPTGRLAAPATPGTGATEPGEH